MPTPAGPARRSVAAALAGAALLLAGVAAAPAAAMDFDALARHAQALAAQPHREPADALPAVLRGLSYDELRDIRYRPERAVWRDAGLPFELMFFPLGRQQSRPVQVSELGPQGVRELAYDPGVFDFGRNRPEVAAARAPGWAGWRVHYALNSPAWRDELAVFLGASYFRALGRGQRYGLSARGLAIDTVGGQGEEFPRFSRFWIERPAPGATALTLLALLESPRAAGAWQFTIRPGDETVMEVRARLFLRAPVATLGLVPLTSMFLHGENQPSAMDFRPEVHDSDGLLIASRSGEWLWRPSFNPKAPLLSSFALPGLAGFGLMQRDRRHAAYEDPEALYERRPSVWVEPLGDWGPGQVQLLLLPTPDETHDNVAAWWTPAQAPAPGQPLDIAYRLRWQGDAPTRPPGGWTVQSRRGRGWAEPAAGEVQFIVDFDGPALRALPAEAAVQAVASLAGDAPPGTRLLEQHAWRHPVTGGWRMALRLLRPRRDQPLELRAFLRSGSHALTETWTTLLPPE